MKILITSKLAALLVLSVMCLVTHGLSGNPAKSYSFTQEPFIKPQILSHMQTWMSDTDPQIVGISLDGSQRSNRFSGTYSVSAVDSGAPWVGMEKNTDLGSTRFAYRHIGKLSNGYEAVHAVSSGDGSGSFHSIMLLVLTEKPLLAPTGIWNHSGESAEWRKHAILQLKGSISIGDWFSGTIELEGNTIRVKKSGDSYVFRIE